MSMLIEDMDFIVQSLDCLVLVLLFRLLLNCRPPIYSVIQIKWTVDKAVSAPIDLFVSLNLCMLSQAHGTLNIAYGAIHIFVSHTFVSDGALLLVRSLGP